MATYIVGIKVDEDAIKKEYKKIGAPPEDIKELVKLEVQMSDYLEVFRIDRVDDILLTDDKDDVAI